MSSALAVNYAAVAAAAERLRGVAHHTPVLTSAQADAISGARVFFKCENFQRVGAFKFRGAYNAISCLSEEQRRRGVVAFSSGNHAQGMALAARMLGVPVAIVMPSDAPAMKLAATREYGAEVILYDRATGDREAIAARLGAERGLAVIPAYDHADVIAGQGTAAKELFDSVGPLDYLFVCTGGGGLLSGSAIAAAHLAPDCVVIGVEPEAGNDAQRSLRSGQIVHIAVPDTIADGAQTQHIGKLVLPILQAHVRDIVTVSDDQLRRQIRFFAERMKIVVEGAGALAAAAVMNRLVDVAGKRVGVIVSGGNIDMALFAECMARGAAEV
ncbi:threo-3-hydroxy-L-aspartate ammonia-lyase [Rugamonas sp. CCM 8940]|uniref:threo-3-hydroxy-L-aspartate ammonia-lyase n=1 Tax=Rugamonas sp. CCM 8940 TaxID=2765359 RepID=UPI0018F5CDA8|nr:threo-3-hydroxy-L-aspartate ammonia-lyase [Rugamonas sp. CCM 8940]MBJ7310324.1 threo-3-hydroxy-L-aspartate ammonia-lyase [Rugamonas sp. CCM 8940]